MKPLIVDASIAVKWFIPEKGSDAAARALDRKSPPIAPDLIRVEVANVIWKLSHRKLLSPEQACRIIRDFLSLQIGIYDSGALIQPALKIAVQTEQTVYDCLYLALAVNTEGTLLTADQRFADCIRNTEWKPHIKLI